MLITWVNRGESTIVRGGLVSKAAAYPNSTLMGKMEWKKLRRTGGEVKDMFRGQNSMRGVT